MTNDPQYLNNISSTVTYGEIRPNVDLYYDVIGMSLKERIVLKSAEAERNFTFQFSTKDLTMSKDEDRILFRSLDGTEVFCMDPLMMYDALGNESPAIDITLECTKDNQNNHEYLLTITPSDQWLDNPERVFPVTIDPSIQTTQNPSSVMDTYISSGSPNYSSYYNWDGLKSAPMVLL